MKLVKLEQCWLMKSTEALEKSSKTQSKISIKFTGTHCLLTGCRLLLRLSESIEMQAGMYKSQLRYLVVENQGVDLGADAIVEDVAEHYAQIADLTGAKPRNMLQLGG